MREDLLKRKGLIWVIRAFAICLLLPLVCAAFYWYFHLSRYATSPRDFARQMDGIKVGVDGENEVYAQIQKYDQVTSMPVSGRPHSAQRKIRFLLSANPKSAWSLDYAIDVYFNKEDIVVAVDFADL